MGRKQEAEQSFRRMAFLHDKTAHPEYGMYLFQEGHKEDAVREFERLVKRQAPMTMMHGPA